MGYLRENLRYGRFISSSSRLIEKNSLEEGPKATSSSSLYSFGLTALKFFFFFNVNLILNSILNFSPFRFFFLLRFQNL